METEHLLVLSLHWSSAGFCVVRLTGLCCTALSWFWAPVDLFSTSCIFFVSHMGGLVKWKMRRTNRVCEKYNTSSGVGDGGMKSKSFSDSELSISMTLGSIHFFLSSKKNKNGKQGFLESHKTHELYQEKKIFFYLLFLWDTEAPHHCPLHCHSALTWSGSAL